MSQIPLGYLDAAGQRAQIILPLTWFTLGVSILVCVIIAILLWVGVRRARLSGGAEQTRTVEVLRGSSGMRWIGIGVGISSVALLVTLVWTMVALARSSAPADTPLTLDVTGQQWWWNVKYNAPQPDQSFITANEIHIPVGVPVLVRLHGADVIHSFWVPKLSGKTDTIPGQTNVTWLQASQPGRYRGQCMEYCGVQHAHMGFEVVAESKEDFQRWREHQLQPAPAPQTDQQRRGMELVVYRCGLCHGVRGTTAAAVVAPDLTHLMSRRTIAAGTLPNGVGTLGGWIEGAEQLKPGTLMPDQNLTGQQLTDTLAYLETLQ
jgi:cytochrome c oxidase subunit II